ncbi:hypothetical protein T4A_2744 [Trichinella pseudospiralis]|uniref:Uncharacterized protein n=1 Tax=Trichinella pseudospiralis TaxID=6337 RepID=A0A0V1ERD4_TRIPS|nr:hypothetical protein T4A_2744 [Trichinella pseudospiralis]
MVFTCCLEVDYKNKQLVSSTFSISKLKFIEITIIFKTLLHRFLFLDICNHHQHLCKQVHKLKRILKVTMQSLRYDVLLINFTKVQTEKVN